MNRTIKLIAALTLGVYSLFGRGPDAEIKAVLNTQVTAWNRGDIPAFLGAYADDCVFVGKEIARGKRQLLARYRKAYPNAAAMGKLTFSDLEVKPLDNKAAVVIAHWHLARDAAGGGPVGGVFSLVLQREKTGWKIVLDHTA